MLKYSNKKLLGYVCDAVSSYYFRLWTAQQSDNNNNNCQHDDEQIDQHTNHADDSESGIGRSIIVDYHIR